MRILTKTLSILGLCGLFLLFVPGCSDEQETREMEFSLSRYSIAFAVTGGTITVEVGTSDSWTASTVADWLSLSQSGSSLLITAEANVSTAEIRSAQVSVVSNSYGTETIEVRQEPAAAAEISVTCGSADHKIDSEGGTFTANVYANCDWTAALAESVEGWTLSYDVSAGTVTVSAEANSGAAINGTIVVSAGEGDLAASEEIAVTQISRDENPYFQYIGTWDVYATDCSMTVDSETSWYGPGTYGTCSIAEYSYSAGKLSLLDWWYLEGTEIDNADYDFEAHTVTVPLGTLWGISRSSNSLAIYLYVVGWNEDFTYYIAAGSTFTMTLNEDGSITVDGLPEGYPIIGLIGQSIGMYKIANTPYFMTPLTLTKSEGEAASSLSLPDFTVSPAEELPEGIPAQLSGTFKADDLTSIVL